MKFGLGQPVRRFEDQTLITGKGRYTDDIKLEKMAQAFVLRSQVAHAIKLVVQLPTQLRSQRPACCLQPVKVAVYSGPVVRP